MKTKQELATKQRERYHSDKVYRKKHIETAIKWANKNREQINASVKRRYANLSITKKKAILAKVRRMRKLGLWKS